MWKFGWETIKTLIFNPANKKFHVFNVNMFFSWFLKISTFFFWNHWMEHMNIFISVFQKLISFIFEWERVVFVTSAKNENIGKLNCRLPHLQPELLNFAFLTCFHAQTHTTKFSEVEMHVSHIPVQKTSMLRTCKRCKTEQMYLVLDTSLTKFAKVY